MNSASEVPGTIQPLSPTAVEHLDDPTHRLAGRGLPSAQQRRQWGGQVRIAHLWQGRSLNLQRLTRAPAWRYGTGLAGSDEICWLAYYQLGISGEPAARAG